MMMMACGSCGKPALWFSKDLWALFCASTGPAASTGRLSCRRRRAGRFVRGRSVRLTLELDRRHVIERRMATHRVIPALDEVEHRHAGLRRRPKRHAIEQLALERREETLAQGIVIAIADRSHRGPDARLATPAAKLDRRVLAALVRMMNDRPGPALRDRHLQRGEHQTGPQVRRH